VKLSNSIISIENQIVKNLDYDEIINDFAPEKQEKLKFNDNFFDYCIMIICMY
jgi:hypothetical protein